ncbi:hypothetical protein CRENBAI_001843, partial [Crenichthys baileyi]
MRLCPAMTGESSPVRATHALLKRTALLSPGGAEEREGEEQTGAQRQEAHYKWDAVGDFCILHSIFS